ncbi:scaffold protein [Burkholderia phage BcepNY3]|nr:head maturation protease [Burkholderia phage BcepNY3]ABR10548.1 scaffold protein [Burkholderia phage BcepNY3]
MPFPENEQPGAGAPPAAGAQPADAAPAGAEGGGNELATIGAALKQLVEQNAQAHAAILQKLEQLGGGAAPAPGAQDGEPDGVRSPQGSEDDEMPGAEDNEEEGPTPRADDEHESAEDNELNPAGGENPTVKPNPHEGYAARGEAPPFGAMDAKSVRTAIDTAVANERKRAAAVEQAKRDVRYVLGGDIALDSASQIYREALTQIGVDVSQVAKGSERAAWQAASAASVAAAHGRTIQPAHAMDSAGANEAASRIDANLAKIKVRG